MKISDSKLKLIKRSDRVIEYDCTFCLISKHASVVLINDNGKNALGVECVACRTFFKNVKGLSQDTNFPHTKKPYISASQKKEYDNQLLEIFPVTVSLGEKYEIYRWVMISFCIFLSLFSIMFSYPLALYWIIICLTMASLAFVLISVNRIQLFRLKRAYRSADFIEVRRLRMAKHAGGQIAELRDQSYNYKGSEPTYWLGMGVFFYYVMTYYALIEKQLLGVSFEGFRSLMIYVFISVLPVYRGGTTYRKGKAPKIGEIKGNAHFQSEPKQFDSGKAQNAQERNRQKNHANLERKREEARQPQGYQPRQTPPQSSNYQSQQPSSDATVAIMKRADEALQRGNVQGALDIANRALEEYPDNLFVKLSRAMLLKRAGLTWPAVEAYLDLLYEDENNAIVHAELGFLFLQLHSYKLSKYHLNLGEKILGILPSPDYYFASIMAHTRASDHNAALQIIDKTLAKFPDPTLYSIRARTLVFLGRIDEALENLFRVLGEKGHYLPAQIELVRIYLIQKKYEEAAHLLSNLNSGELSEDDLIKISAYGVKLNLGTRNYGNIQGLLEKVQQINENAIEVIIGELNREGFNEEANELIHQLMEERPHNKQLLSIYANNLYNNKDYTGSITTYNKIIETSDGIIDAETRAKYALALETSGEHEKAIREIQLILDQDHQNIYAITFYSSFLINEGNYEKAISMLDIGLSISPNATRLYLVKGLTCIKAGQFKEAQELFNQIANSEDPGITADTIISYMIDLSVSTSLNPRILLFAKLLVDSDPSNADHLALMARCSFSNHEEEKGISTMKAAISKENKKIVNRIHLGEMYEHRKNFNLAKISYEEAYQLFPTHRIVLKNLGLLNYNLLEFADSARILEKLVHLEPKNQGAWDYLILSLMKLDNLEYINEMVNKLIPICENSNSKAKLLMMQATAISGPEGSNEALNLINQAISADPLQDYFLAKSMLQTRMNDHVGALETLEKMIEMFGEDVMEMRPDYEFQYALTLYYIGDYDKAKVKLDLVLMKYPNYPQADILQDNIRQSLENLKSNK